MLPGGGLRLKGRQAASTPMTSLRHRVFTAVVFVAVSVVGAFSGASPSPAALDRAGALAQPAAPNSTLGYWLRGRLGLVPGQIDPTQEETLFTEIYRLTGLRADDVRARYASFPPGSDWYLPLGEVASSEVASRYNVLSGLSGSLPAWPELRETRQRFGAPYLNLRPNTGCAGRWRSRS
jgi:hypothetical protein